MALINGSVGQGGLNAPGDVRVVQRLLNRHPLPPLRRLAVDGIAGPHTVAAIRQFQERVVKMRSPDGRVDPGGATLRQLNQSTGGGATSRAAAAPGQASRLSGAAWWRANQAKYPNSRRLEDLDGQFRDNCRNFISALRTAGATVSIGSTRRNKIRAHLMHYSWKVAKGQMRASAVPAIAGLGIIWDHGDDKASAKAAQEMVDLFHMAHIASLTSNHISGKAIDMTISWNGTLNIARAGQRDSAQIRMGPRSGNNVELQRVGDTYGVKKLRTDPPHWSINGH